MFGVRVDPARYRQTLLDSITDDGLEELTLRLARDEHGDAHRAGKGKDAGIDVLSDFGQPPRRAWQAKNVKQIDWDECRDSLRQAMGTEHPPLHYTYVFPRPLTGPQREFWRNTFLPQQVRLYPQLESLDFWDHLAERLEDRPELVNILSEGAFASGYRSVAELMAQTGVNPLASITDLVGDAPELARRAVEAGRTDPRYRYETRQREAHEDDLTIPDGRIRIGFEALPGKPREFTATLRAGREVQEKAARPRKDVEPGPVRMWFADTPQGDTARQLIRADLAAGRPVDVVCNEHVGLEAGTVPDRFRDMVDNDGTLHRGEAHLGLSEPFQLKVSMQTDAGPTPEATIALYRIPSPPGHSISYGGSFHGALLFLDLNPNEPRPDGQPGLWTASEISGGLDPDTDATEVLTGLGFAMSLQRATHIKLDCPELITGGSVSLDLEPGAQSTRHADQVLERAAIIANALAALTQLDSRPRTLPDAVSDGYVALADMVYRLLTEREVRVTLDAPYRYSVPDETDTSDLEAVMRGVARPLAPIASQPTVIAQLRIEGPASARLVASEPQQVVEITPQSENTQAVMTLVGPVAGDATGDDAQADDPPTRDK
jgi:hypothetical protein